MSITVSNTSYNSQSTSDDDFLSVLGLSDSYNPKNGVATSTSSVSRIENEIWETDDNEISRSEDEVPAHANASCKSLFLFSQRPTWTLRKIIIISCCSGFLFGFILLTVTLGIPEDAEQASIRAETRYIENEVAIPMLASAVRLESLKGKNYYWNNKLLTSHRELDYAVLPKIRGGLEAEGFKISSLKFTKLSSLNVTIYSVMNHTMTSLTLPEVTNGSEIKSVGSRDIIRAAFQCSGIPSKNTILTRVDANDAGSIQFMLGNYLGNQEVVARVEQIEIFGEFRSAVKSALRIIPRLASLDRDDHYDVIYIACHKSGKSMTTSNLIVRCPPDCHEITNYDVIGSDYYHIESSVCLSAVHSEVFKVSEGGVVEYLEIGSNFVFEARSSNGINSTGFVEFGRSFVVKNPGPSWIEKERTDVITSTVATLLGERNKVLMDVSFVMIQLDGQRTSYAMTRSPRSGNPIRESISRKVKRSFEKLNFDLALVKVTSIEPYIYNTASMRVKIQILGGFKSNAWAMFPYKPWNEREVKSMEEDIRMWLGRIEIDEFALSLNNEFLEELLVMPSTTRVPLTKYPSKCGCGDVFFVQSRDSSRAVEITNMYKTLFRAFDFDQVKLGLGLSLGGRLITEVGQDLPDAVLRRFNEAMSDPVQREDLALWRLVAQLESEASFFTRGLGKRKKLLVVSSTSVFDPDSATNLIYLNRLKEKGVLIAFVGYDWDDELLQAHYYPQQFASKPSANFVKHVENPEYFSRLTSFLGDVIRKYICEAPPMSCDDINFNLSPPIELQYNFTLDGARSSYARGIPVGTGLKLYDPSGGIRYNEVQLLSMSKFRRTEPDRTQAFYLKYNCGQPANSPSLQTGRIVGGTEAIPHTWPWAVSINYLKKSKEKYSYNFWKCGGSVVQERWIITAAHCFADGNKQVQDTKYQVVVGRHDQKVYETLPGNVYKISRIIYHPQYDDARNKFDVALLQLNRDIQYRREVSPVCLPNADVIPRTGRECWVVGWGFTSNSAATSRNRLKQALQFIQSPDKCQSTYRRYYYDPNYNVCSKKSATTNVNMQCRGDSGGPLVCRENQRWVLYGISNFGPKYCESGGESGYLLVPSVMTWLCCHVKITPCAYVKCQFGD